MGQPPALRGEVVQPDYVSQPHSFAAHDFFNLFRDLLHRTTWHNESDLNKVLDVVSAYEQHVVGKSDLAAVQSENDRAPVEDVSLRQAAAPVQPSAVAGTSIDYARLAAAIVAQQQAAAQQQSQVHEVTDVPAQQPAPEQPQVQQTQASTASQQAGTFTVGGPS